MITTSLWYLACVIVGIIGMIVTGLLMRPEPSTGTIADAFGSMIGCLFGTISISVTIIIILVILLIKGCVA